MTRAGPETSIWVAQLGPYDAPWLAAAHDALWSALARRLIADRVEGVPESLDRRRDMEEVWRAPDLLLAHTCGYPLTTQLAGHVRLVSTPIYASPFALDVIRDHGPVSRHRTSAACYRSAIVVSARSDWTALDQLRGSVLGLNAWNSNSGMNLLRAAVAPLAQGARFFARVEMTGSHQASLAAVASGAVDVAAIDGVTMALTARHRPDLVQGTRVLATTPAAPGLPLITRGQASDETVARLRAGLDALIDDPSCGPARDALGLRGFAHAELGAYDRILDLERDAVALGYPTLA